MQRGALQWLTPSRCVYTPAAGRALPAAQPVAAAPVQVGQRAKFRRGPVTAPLLDLSCLPGQRRWPSWAQAGVTCCPCSPRAALWFVLLAGFFPLPVPVCFWVLQPLTVGSGGAPPLWHSGGAAWGTTDLNLASWAVQGDCQAGVWSSCLRALPCQPCHSLKTHVGQRGGMYRAPPLAEQSSSLALLALC